MAETGKPALIVAVADPHTNSYTGLNPPSFQREMESRHTVGKIGRALWRSWLEFWRIVAAKKVEHDAMAYVFAVGDLGDMIRLRGTELITRNETEILAAMAEVAEPMAQAADHLFVLRGTEAHTGGSGKLEELLARDLCSAEWYSKAVASWWVAHAEIAGLRFLVTHHPPTTGKLPWTLDQAVSRAASITAGQYLDDGKINEMPHICLWAHYHSRGAQARGMGGVWGFFLPPWQLATGFTHRIGQSAKARTVGGLWLLVQGGQVIDWDWERWTIKADKTWTMP